jgi:hypothetical protein
VEQRDLSEQRWWYYGKVFRAKELAQAAMQFFGSDSGYELLKQKSE